MRPFGSYYFIDFRKAYDSVNYQILLAKLCKLDLHHVLITWPHCFLHQRQRRIKIEDTTSPWLIMNEAISRGSWLGFVLHSN